MGSATLARALSSQFLYKELISDVLWGRLVGRIVRDEECSEVKAEKILDATLGFLKLCGVCPDKHLVPSKMVDIGWHTFLMYTREYEEFCLRVAGKFIHHSPNDLPGPKPMFIGIRPMLEIMSKHGFEYDPEMWELSEVGKCTTSDCRDDCHWCAKEAP